VAVGLALGYLSRVALARIHDGYAETTVTVLVPFVAYVGAEHVNGSGVLAVLVLGLYLRTFAHDATTSGGWLLGRAVWSYADFLITSLVFTLLGFELVAVIRSTGPGSGTMTLAALVVGTLVVFRAVWIYPAAWLARLRARRRDDPVPTDWRESTVVAWAGMRGVVTVATAVALPSVVATGDPLPHRDEVVTVALVAVLVTLVVQGLTLTPLTTYLRVGSDVDETAEVAELRMRATRAALAQIRDEASDLDEDVRTAAFAQYEGYLTAQQTIHRARSGDDGEDGRRARELESVLRRASDAERQLVLEARRRGEVAAGSADEVLRDIENRALRDFD
jgi:CPA1 family monovalent cation:H+ antiporter